MLGYDPMMRSPSSDVILLLLLFSCTTLLLPFFPSASASASDDADRLALLTFKSGVSSDPYGSLDSWSNNNNSNSSSLHDHCRWRGVTCSNSSSRVTTLDLDSLGLAGVLIIGGRRGSLSHLQKLRLGNNSFHGIIPSGIGRRLPSLTHLNLSFNLFEGSIPPTLARHQQLLVIDLNGNMLDGNIPEELGALSKLVVLNLAMNNLTGSIPPSLLLLGGSNLSSLQQLDLSHNILTQLPAPNSDLALGLHQLSSSSSSFSLLYLDLSKNKLVGSVPPYLLDRPFHALEMLDLSYNSLNGAIPPQISNLVNLRILDLSRNSLNGAIPPQIFNLVNLWCLDLSANSLNGAIPPQIISNLVNLQYLDLSDNSLQGPIPPSLTNLSSLTILELSSNRLQGPLPVGLDRLTQLEFFQVSENRLSGTIPLALYNISSLQTLAVSHNRLSGTLPPNMGDTLPSLTHLNMLGNCLEGSIPSSLSNASGLTHIDLGNNTLSGRVPTNLGKLRHLYWLSLRMNRLGEHDGNWDFLASLTNCTQLKYLSLQYNNLEGELPSSFANLSTKLTWLSLGGNRLSGSIPQGIGNFVDLTVLLLESNSFSGAIPTDSIAKLQSLGGLDLSVNRFSGTVPPSLGNLTRLTNLLLNGNELQGSIPESLGSCLSLNYLDLSDNHLSGSIPTQLFRLSSLSEYLNLSNNVLEGPLPFQVGHLLNIGVMDVSNNRLSGTIPSTLGDCQELGSLHLQGNLFQGIIPQSLGSLKGISELDLSSNSLTGRFPEFLADLQYLRYLNLSFNHLEGQLPTKGVFRTATAVSVYGNDKLCGGIPELHLPTCHEEEKKKKKNKWRVIIPVSVFGVLSLILLCGFLTIRFLRKDSKARLSASPTMDPVHPKVSYFELLRATRGFSSENLIGSGNYGSVYKGTINDGKAIAVKVLNLESRGALKSFMSECEALRNIRHRNLVKILTTCSTTDSRGNDFKALVYEFMPNGSLEGWLHPESDGRVYNAKGLNLTQRVNIAIDVAAAVDYLHNQCATTIVHCDLKPSNVLLDDNMTAHVGDFGLSKFLPMSLVPTNAIEGIPSSSSVPVRGSIGYVPPEYGMGGSVSTHGDIFSYGMLLLELFTGIRPTDGQVLKDGLTLQKHVEGQLSKGFSHEIGDPSLILNEDDERIVGEEMKGRYIAVVEQCLLSVFAIALSCVKESPRDRVKIKHVVTQMHHIRNGLLQEMAQL